MAGRRRIVTGILLCFTLGAVSTFAMFATGAPSASVQTKLELRLAEEQPASGLVEATVSHSDKKVYLHQSAVITNDDVNGARVVPAGGTAFNVAISFTPQGAAKMEAATQAHIGRPLAILVNGRVVSAPTLRGAIHQDAVISGDFTRAEADDIAAGLMGR